MTQTAPGWYPDPGAPPGVAPHVRYWDGNAWTHHVQPVQGGPPMAPAPTGPTTADGERLSGWWWRVLAQCLDGIFVSIVANIAMLPIQIDIQRDLAGLDDRYLGDPADPNYDPDFAGFWQALVDVYQDHALSLVVVAILPLVYYALFLRWKGATPGKMICGLRVRLKERPGQLPWSTIVVRTTVQSLVPSVLLFGALLTGSIALLVIGYVFALGFLALDALWATWNKNRQTIHDLAAKTQVVRTR